MLIKVMNIKKPKNSSSKDMNYGIVDSFEGISAFNSFRKEEIYNYDAIVETFIPFKTIIKYTRGSVFASENIRSDVSDDSIDSKRATEIVFDYVMVSGILEIMQSSDGDKNEQTSWFINKCFWVYF